MYGDVDIYISSVIIIMKLHWWSSLMIIIGVIMDRKNTYLNKTRAVSFHYTLVVQNPLFFEFVL